MAMDIADIERALQQAISDWSITVELAHPTQGDPFKVAPVVVYATRKMDRQIFTSRPFPRPETDVASLVEGLRRELAKIT